MADIIEYVWTQIAIMKWRQDGCTCVWSHSCFLFEKLYILVCSLWFPMRPTGVLKTETALRCEHACMYVCTSSCIWKSVCNWYIIENKRKKVAVCSELVELVAWKLLYCSTVCLHLSGESWGVGGHNLLFSSEVLILVKGPPSFSMQTKLMLLLQTAVMPLIQPWWLIFEAKWDLASAGITVRLV